MHGRIARTHLLGVRHVHDHASLHTPSIPTPPRSRVRAHLEHLREPGLDLCGAQHRAHIRGIGVLTPNVPVPLLLPLGPGAARLGAAGGSGVPAPCGISGDGAAGAARGVPGVGVDIVLVCW
jgi:hypothetical protein